MKVVSLHSAAKVVFSNTPLKLQPQTLLFLIASDFCIFKAKRNRMKETLLHYQVALSFLNGIGPKLARQAVAYVGSVEGIFTEKKRLFEKIPGIGKGIAAKMNVKEALEHAETELAFIEKHKIACSFYLDKNYPDRLRDCEDAPLMLFSKGRANVNSQHIISVVGTRNASNYGRNLTESFVRDFSQRYPDGIILSGLAYGIDVCAHKAALQNNLRTMAVLGTGLDVIYPAIHRNTAKQMLERGALITEFCSNSKPDRQNFVKRNRIVAGMADAVVVVETGLKGGSLITANLALSYNRDVFAFPGNVGLEFSSGCNNLIKTNRAGLIESFEDFEQMMGWEPQNTKKAKGSVFIRQNLSEDEKVVLEAIRKAPEAETGLLSKLTQIDLNRLNSLLFEMEMKGMLKKLPGNIFELT